MFQMYVTQIYNQCKNKYIQMLTIELLSLTRKSKSKVKLYKEEQTLNVRFQYALIKVLIFLGFGLM